MNTAARRAYPALAPPCRSTRQIRLWKNYNDCHYSRSAEGERGERMVVCWSLGLPIYVGCGTVFPLHAGSEQKFSCGENIPWHKMQMLSGVATFSHSKTIYLVASTSALFD